MNDVHRRILGLGRRPGQSCRLPEWSHLAFSPRGQFISKAFSRTKSWNKIKLLYATSLRYRKILSEERTMFVYNNSLLWLVRAERKSLMCMIVAVLRTSIVLTFYSTQKCNIMSQGVCSLRIYILVSFEISRDSGFCACWIHSASLGECIHYTDGSSRKTDKCERPPWLKMHTLIIVITDEVR